MPLENQGRIRQVRYNYTGRMSGTYLAVRHDLHYGGKSFYLIKITLPKKGPFPIFFYINLYI